MRPIVPNGIMRKTLGAIALLLCCQCVANPCERQKESERENLPIATIEILPGSATVALGTTRALHALARDANGHEILQASYTWTSSAPSVASINDAGMLTAVALGTTGVTAAADGITSAPATVTVVDCLGLPPNVKNEVTVRERSGTAHTNHPMQIGRPFLACEITNAPTVLVDGTPVATQADVKQRHADGSVKFAVLSFVLPSVPANAQLKLTFADQIPGTTTAPSKEELLGAAYDFDAQVEIRAGPQTATASARTMLEADASSVWTSGPVATTLVLADHSVTRAYDMGFDGLRSVRPLFHVTFWPTLNKTRVRFIAENSNTETLQDVTYDAQLKLGKTAPTVVWNKTGIKHYAATRWTKVFWTGEAPSEQIDIDHNLPYLAQTRFVLNYDTEAAFDEATLASTYATWQGKPRDVGEDGMWTKYMPTTGGRWDIGPYPMWVVRWLYSGDWRLREIALGQADLAGSWPLQVREGDESKRFDRAQTLPAVGRVISVHARPTEWLFDDRGTPTPEDAVEIQGTRLRDESIYPPIKGGWDEDGAHQPDPFSAPYLLTGDFFYLEQSWMWAAAQALKYCVGNVDYCRGAGIAGIHDQIRGNAWVLRNRVHAAALAPDGTAEQAYFKELVDEAIAFWEAEHDLHGSALESNPAFVWRHQYGRFETSPLHFWSRGNEPRENNGVDTSQVLRAEGVWMDYFLLIELGRAREQGFATGNLLSYLAPVLIGQFMEPGYSRYMTKAYYTPVVRKDGTDTGSYYQTWTETLSGYTADALATCTAQTFCSGSYYAMLALAASTMLLDEPNGVIPYAWLDAEVRQACPGFYRENLEWALKPR